MYTCEQKAAELDSQLSSDCWRHSHAYSAERKWRQRTSGGGSFSAHCRRAVARRRRRRRRSSERCRWRGVEPPGAPPHPRWLVTRLLADPTLRSDPGATRRQGHGAWPALPGRHDCGRRRRRWRLATANTGQWFRDTDSAGDPFPSVSVVSVTAVSVVCQLARRDGATGGDDAAAARSDPGAGGWKRSVHRWVAGDLFGGVTGALAANRVRYTDN